MSHAFENSIKLIEVPLSIMKRLEPRITNDIYKVLDVKYSVESEIVSEGPVQKKLREGVMIGGRLNA